MIVEISANILIIFILFLITACSPTVRLDTPEPVKIDVNMKVDVTTDTKEKAPKQSIDSEETKKNPLQSRRLRMAEIQDLKNNRLIGEGNDGLLNIRQHPEDPEWNAYMEKLVREENADRQDIFSEQAKETNKPVEMVAKEFARKMREAAFPNEWIQTEEGDWIQN